MEKVSFANVDQYLASFPEEARAKLELVRSTIREAVPDAEEVISYQMPMYQLNSWRLHLGGFKKHFSLFVPHSDTLIEAFKDELAGYETHKATFRFPLEGPVPVDLIRRIARYRIEEHREEVPPKRRPRR